MSITNIILSVYLIPILYCTVSMIRMQRKKEIRINLRIIEAFETWLNKTIAMQVTNFILEIAGKDMIKDDEIAINSSFVVDGIQDVCSYIVSYMPNAYQDYMIKFYGEDKFINAIHDKVRLVFIEYVNNERTRRLSSARKAEYEHIKEQKKN